MHHIYKVFSAARLRVVKVFFVGATAIIADLVTPAARQHLLLLFFLLTCIFARILAVAPFVGAPPGVLIDQDPINQTHELDQGRKCIGMKKLAIVGKCMSDELVVLDVVFGAESDAFSLG